MDEHLRELERQAAQGDLEAQARLLTERVRIGALEPDRLALAAFLGHPGARLAVGDAPGLESVARLGTWVAKVEDPDVLIRLTLGLARLLNPEWVSLIPNENAPLDAVAEVERWLTSGDLASVEKAQRRISTCGDSLAFLVASVASACGDTFPTLDQVRRGLGPPEEHQRWEDALTDLGHDESTFLGALRAACAGPQGEAPLALVITMVLTRPMQAAQAAYTSCAAAAGNEAAWVEAGDVADAALRIAGTQATRAAIRDSLTPWLLAP